MEEMNNEKLSPAEYFGAIKERKTHVTDEELKQVYDNCLELLNKYKITCIRLRRGTENDKGYVCDCVI